MNKTNSLLHIVMNSNSGNVNLVHSMPNQKLELKKAIITWADTADSLAAGTHIDIDFDFFSHIRINSNRTTNINALPIFNDTTKSVTLFTTDIEIDTDSSIKQSFPYRVYNAAGALVTNLTSVELLFSYDGNAVF